MNIEGYYYLHQNGQLIYQKALPTVLEDLREGDFVQQFWPVDRKDRESLITLVIEAQALGAESGRARQLMDKWLINEDELQAWADRYGAVLKLDGSSWCATRIDFEDLVQSPAGFGTTKFDALVNLAKELGLKANKTLRVTFDHLLNRRSS